MSFSNESEYDFHEKIELHFINFNYDYSYIPEEEIEKFKEYMNGNEDLEIKVDSRSLGNEPFNNAISIFKGKVLN